MGLFDFLFGKKKETEVEEDTLEPLEEPQEQVLISETSYSSTWERGHEIFENIDFKVVGTSFNQDAIKKAVNSHKDEMFFDEKYEGLTNNEILEDTIDEPIFEYGIGMFSDSELQLEPNNEYDTEAIAVYIRSYMVGYVPKKDFEDGKKYIYKLLTEGVEDNQELIFSITLRGGKYKVNRDGDEIIKGESDYKLDATLTLKTTQK